MKRLNSTKSDKHKKAEKRIILFKNMIEFGNYIIKQRDNEIAMLNDTIIKQRGEIENMQLQSIYGDKP